MTVGLMYAMNHLRGEDRPQAYPPLSFKEKLYRCLAVGGILVGAHLLDQNTGDHLPPYFDSMEVSDSSYTYKDRDTFVGIISMVSGDCGDDYSTWTTSGYYVNSSRISTPEGVCSNDGNVLGTAQEALTKLVKGD